METRSAQKYNQAYTLNFNLYQIDGIDMEPAATFAAGDIVIMKDEGAEANTTNLPTDEGTGYSLVLTAAEMSAARIVLYIIDQTGTKVWLDIAIDIETYGNASAQHAFDLDTALVTLAAATHTGAVIPTVSTLTNLPAITAGWLTATGIAASALDGKGNWNVGKTGYTLVQAFPTNFSDLAIEVTNGKVTGNTVDTATNLTNAPTAGDLTAAMKASVNAEVDTALDTTTYAEPAQGAPGATITLAQKIGYLYKFLRNKGTNDGASIEIYNDDGVTVDHKSATSEVTGTVTRAEFGTGP